MTEDIVVKVLRNGNITQVSKSELVPGDIVYLETGDMIPADGRFVETVDFCKIVCYNSVVIVYIFIIQ